MEPLLWCQINFLVYCAKYSHAVLFDPFCTGNSRINCLTRENNKAMYAVIKTGGKQYKVATGEKLKIESLGAEVGETINLDEVLMLVDGDNVSIGSPHVSGASVAATVLSHGRGKKVKIFKLRRRKHYKRQQGHRQNFTEVVIGDITS